MMNHKWSAGLKHKETYCDKITKICFRRLLEACRSLSCFNLVSCGRYLHQFELINTMVLRSFECTRAQKRCYEHDVEISHPTERTSVSSSHYSAWLHLCRKLVIRFTTSIFFIYLILCLWSCVGRASKIRRVVRIRAYHRCDPSIFQATEDSACGSIWTGFIYWIHNFIK